MSTPILQNLDIDPTVAEAKDRRRVAGEARAEHDRLAQEDMEFRFGDQWNTLIRTQRQADQRPCVTNNRLPQFEQQVVNGYRQNKQATLVVPRSTDDPKVQETAEVAEGLLRYTEHASNADMADVTALMWSTRTGLGWLGVGTRYTAEDAEEQEVYFRRHDDPFDVLLDPSYAEFDGSDAMWGFVERWVAKDAYQNLYPNTALAEAWAGFQMSGVRNRGMQWVTRSRCLLAEYYVREGFEDTLLIFPDHSTAWASSYEPDEKVSPSREVPGRQRQRVMQYLINGVEVLSKTRIPGVYIPLVPVVGTEAWVKGSRVYEGIIRHAKDACRISNAMDSAMIETIALAPRAPWVLAEGQDEGFEQEWDTVHLRNRSRVHYKPKDLNGEVLPPPKRNIEEPAIEAIVRARTEFDNALYAVTGIYPPQFGQPSNERSGRAINARVSQGALTTYHYVDNLNVARRHRARIALAMMREVYGMERTITILGEDMRPVVVDVNKQSKDGSIYNLRDLRSEVVMSTGPDYETKTQAVEDFITNLIQQAPGVMNVAGDLLIESSSLPLHQKQRLSARMKALLPPQVAAAESQNVPLPPGVAGEMMRMHTMIQTLTEQVNTATSALMLKKMELESRERIAVIQARGNIIAQSLAAESKENVAAFEGQLGLIEKKFDLLASLIDQETTNADTGDASDGGGAEGGGGAALAGSGAGGPIPAGNGAAAGPF